LNFVWGLMHININVIITMPVELEEITNSTTLQNQT